MRISNVMGAFFGLLMGVGLTYTTATPLYNFVSNGMTGDAKVLALLGTGALYLLLIIGIPIMMAIEDETKVE